MEKAAPSESVKERVANLIDSITFSVYQYTTRGLFECDKLTYLAQLTFQVKSNSKMFPQVIFTIQSVNIKETSFEVISQTSSTWPVHMCRPTAGQPMANTLNWPLSHLEQTSWINHLAFSCWYWLIWDPSQNGTPETTTSQSNWLWPSRAFYGCSHSTSGEVLTALIPGNLEFRTSYVTASSGRDFDLLLNPNIKKP